MGTSEWTRACGTVLKATAKVRFKTLSNLKTSEKLDFQENLGDAHHSSDTEKPTPQLV